MDGDEKGSCGTAVCDGGPGDDAEDEAVAPGDVAPIHAGGEPTEPDSAEQASEPDSSAPDDSVPDVSGSEPNDVVPDDSVPDAAERDEQVSVEDDAPAAAEASDRPEVVEAAVATDAASPAQPLRRHLRRGVVALVAAGFLALVVGAFAWVAPSAEGVDQRFVEAAQSEGHEVAPGEQQTLLVSAARKICDRRVIHETDRERRATALTSDEIAAVGAVFGADTRDFTTLALKTYCSS